jgi:rod shape-determining protein MreD
METLLSALLIFTTMFVQTTVFDPLTLGGIKPDLALIVVIYFALLHSTSAAVGTGLVMGLLQDILSGGLMGVNLLTKSLAGYLFGLIGRQVVVANLVNQAVLVFLASLLDGGLTFFILKITQLTTPGRGVWVGLILPQAAYNGLICLILIPLLARLHRVFLKKRLL